VIFSGSVILIRKGSIIVRMVNLRLLLGFALTVGPPTQPSRDYRLSRPVQP